ncbi:MAG: regulatory iron-sulfur-containing complex subunit RicT, partial [Erysipelotrichales bacterium]
TVHGIELATIVDENIDNKNLVINDMMPVVRVATKKDFDAYENNKVLAQKGFIEFNDILRKFDGLDMTLVSCEYSLDQTKILFMYVSDDRVDFRELLKALASHFKKRIELKQIGARDKAKMIGGLGPCGMETCCSRFIKDFDNISINMAKNQMLSLNPSNISGLCGRLLCCLKYENEAYTQAKKNYPKINSKIKYDGRECKVVGLNILMDQVKIEDERMIKLVSKEDIKW